MLFWSMVLKGRSDVFSKKRTDKLQTMSLLKDRRSINTDCYNFLALTACTWGVMYLYIKVLHFETGKMLSPMDKLPLEWFYQSQELRIFLCLLVTHFTHIWLRENQCCAAVTLFYREFISRLSLRLSLNKKHSALKMSWKLHNTASTVWI